MQTLEEFDEECPLTSSFCKLISSAEFDEQSVAYTEQALRELYKTMDQSPRLCERVVRKRKQRELEKSSIASFIEAKFFSTVQGHLNRCNAMGSTELRQRLGQLKEEMQKVCSYSREAKCMRTGRSNQMNSRCSSLCSTSSSSLSTISIGHPPLHTTSCFPHSPTFSFQPLSPFSFPAAAPFQLLPETSGGVQASPAANPPPFSFSSLPSACANSVPSGSVPPALTPSVVRVQVHSSSGPPADPPPSNHCLLNSTPATDSCVFSPSSLTTARMPVLATVDPASVTLGPPASHPGPMALFHIPFSSPVPAPAHPGQGNFSSVPPTIHLCESATTPLLTSSSTPVTCHQDAVTPSSLPPTCHPDAVIPSSEPSTCHQDTLMPSSAPSTCHQDTVVPSSTPFPCHQDAVLASSAPSTCHEDTVMPSSTPSTCHEDTVMPSSTCYQDAVTPSSAPSTCHQDTVSPSTAPATCHQDAVMPSSTPSTCHQDAVMPSSAPSTYRQDAVTPSSAPYTCHQDAVMPSSAPSTCHQDAVTPSSAPTTCHQDAVIPSFAPSTCHQDTVTPSFAPSTCHQDTVTPYVLTRPHIHPDVKTTLSISALLPPLPDSGVPYTSSSDPVSVPSVCAPPPAPPLPPAAPPLPFTPHRNETISKQMLDASTPDLLASDGLKKLTSKSVLEHSPITPLPDGSRGTISSLQSELRAGNHTYRLRKTGLVRSPGGTPVMDTSTTNIHSVSFNTSLLNKFQNVNSPDSSNSEGEQSGFETPCGSPTGTA